MRMDFQLHCLNISENINENLELAGKIIETNTSTAACTAAQQRRYAIASSENTIMTSFLIMLFLPISVHMQFFLPIYLPDRRDISKIHLTENGHFGIKRKARISIPEHYHTGIDIKRPNDNYESEPIYPIATGRVISKRTDGPYANVLIEHEINGNTVWTLYEHISGITVHAMDSVNSHTPIARFMNKDELNRFGWQFDHFHLEILKVKPKEAKPTREHPERYFNSYTLICYSIYELHKYYFNPIEFLTTNK